MDGKLLFFSALFAEAEHKAFSGRIIVFDPKVHDGADPGKSVGKSGKEGAIAEADVVENLDSVQKLLDLAINERRRFASDCCEFELAVWPIV